MGAPPSHVARSATPLEPPRRLSGPVPSDGARVGRGRGHADAGQATVLLALVLLVAVAGAVLLANLGRVAADRARARTAADAAALAAATTVDPAEATVRAREAARRNGGEVEAVTVRDGVAEVTVRVGSARATSAAATTWRAARTIGPAGVRVGARGSVRSRPFPYTCADALDRPPADPRCGG